MFTGAVDSQVHIDWNSKYCFAADILSDNFASASESWDKRLTIGNGFVVENFCDSHVEDAWFAH